MRICTSCGQEFEISKEHEDWYNEKKVKLPTICKFCIKARKISRNSTYGITDDAKRFQALEKIVTVGMKVWRAGDYVDPTASHTVTKENITIIKHLWDRLFFAEKESALKVEEMLRARHRMYITGS